jgi:hypothetical protein
MSILQAALVLLISTAPALAAASSPRASYSAALAHERSMRSTNYGLKQLRAAIAKYEAVVRQSPRSGYSDNALWQASGLAL